MKMWKRLAGGLTVLLLAFSWVWSVLGDQTGSGEQQAEAPERVIEIKNAQRGYTYEAYQIFGGTSDQEGKVLSDAFWGSGIDSAGLLSELCADEEWDTHFHQADTAEEVAEKLAEGGEKIGEAFARAAAKHLTGASGISEETEGGYRIRVTGDGYYLIKNTGKIPDGGAATRYILQVCHDITVPVKADFPMIEKRIQGGGHSGGASIGDRISYEVLSRVPDMAGYTKYYFIVKDRMSEGLTPDIQSFTVTLGEKQLKENEDFLIKTEGMLDDSDTMEVVFKDFIQYQDCKHERIRITYEAVLNEKAAVGADGNENNVRLVYSNDPNAAGSGAGGEDPDMPAEGDPTGVTPVTPEGSATVFTSGVQILKTDVGGERLPGAAFKLTGERKNLVRTVSYAWKTGADGEKRLERRDAFMEEKRTDSTVAVTSDTGLVQMEGLGPGDYQLEEVQAPDGYHRLKKPILIKIRYEEKMNDRKEIEPEWKVSLDGAVQADEETAEGGVARLRITNRKGALMPMTGGSGSTAWTLSAVLLILLGGSGFALARYRKH